MILLRKSIQLDFVDRTENCEVIHTHKVTKGNVIVGKSFHNYIAETHTDYVVYSKMNHPHAVTNTRFLLLDGKREPVKVWFVNLNWIQRRWLRLQTKRAWFHDKAHLSIVLSIIALLISLAMLMLRLTEYIIPKQQFP